MHSDLIVGITGIMIGQIIQIAYHHYHDRRQNGLLKRMGDLLEKIEENQRKLERPL